MVEGGVDLVEGRVDGVWGWGAACASGGDERSEWSEQTGAQLDQQHAELQAERSQSVAAALAEAFHQPFGAQFAQVVTQLAEAVVSLGELGAASTGIPSSSVNRRTQAL